MTYSRKLHGHFTACGPITRSGCIGRLISTGARLARSYTVIRLSVLLGIIVALWPCGVVAAEGPAKKGTPRPADSRKAIKDVTPQERLDFLKLLEKLPTDGEFFSKEALRQAKPYLPAMLAITKADLREFYKGQEVALDQGFKRDDLLVFPLLVLSGDMLEDPDNREYASRYFAQIRHPILKAAWGARIVEKTQKPSDEIIAYLEALSKQPGQNPLSPYRIALPMERIRHLRSPGSNPLRSIPALDTAIALTGDGHRTTLRQTARYRVPGFPERRRGFGDADHCVFGPDKKLYCLRPEGDKGELCVVDPIAKSVRRYPVLQPAGFQPEYPELDNFEYPNWTAPLTGNGST